MVSSDVTLKKEFPFDGFEEKLATFCDTECWLVSSFGGSFQQVCVTVSAAKQPK